jgi:hypothetical protein
MLIHLPVLFMFIYYVANYTGLLKSSLLFS